MTELGDDARHMLEAFRSEERPSDERRDRILADLQGAARPRRRIEVARTAEPVDRRGPRWVVYAASVAAAAIVLIGARWMMATPDLATRGDGARPAAASHDQQRQDSVGVASPGRASAPDDDHAGQQPSETEPTARAEVAQPGLATPASPVRTDRARPTSDPLDTSEELTLIEQARRALDDDDPTKALRLLDRHERRFASGELAPERALLRARALCQSGRLGEARALASRFVADHPDSSYAGKMRRVCVQRPSGL